MVSRPVLLKTVTKLENQILDLDQKLWDKDLELRKYKDFYDTLKEMRWDTSVLHGMTIARVQNNIDNFEE